MIDLDKRILAGKKPLTAFDEVDSKFIGTDCYFSDNASDFMNVVLNCQKGRLLSIGEITGLFNATKNNSYAVFNYCLPCEWVKKEPKYRPFSLAEWIDKHEIGDVVHYRSKSGEIELRQMYVGTRHSQGIKNIIVKITLGEASHTLDYLFEDYEIEVNGEWLPFGVLDNGEDE